MILQHIRDKMRKNLLDRAGVVPTYNHCLNELKKSEWSSEFESLMRSRLVFGAMRYGKIHAKGKVQFDRVGSCVDRLEMYNRTGNTEYLVDVANLCLLEFEEGQHPTKHFTTIHSGQQHVKEKKL